MADQKSRDTQIEVALRSRLHARGLRYRIHAQPLPTLRREADILFPRVKVAVFVDGCFWHGCPEHGTTPKANSDWWRSKIERNRNRDLDTERRLRDAGWKVVRCWEHEDPDEMADRIERLVRSTGTSH